MVFWKDHPPHTYDPIGDWYGHCLRAAALFVAFLASPGISFTPDLRVASMVGENATGRAQIETEGSKLWSHVTFSDSLTRWRRGYSLWNDPCAWSVMTAAYESVICGIHLNTPTKCPSGFKLLAMTDCPDKPFLTGLH